MTEPSPLEVDVALTHAGLPAAHLNVLRTLERGRFAPGAPVDGTELPSLKLASWIRVHPVYARRLLRELVALDVIELTVEGSGRRGHAFKFRPIASWAMFRADRIMLEVVQLRVKQLTDPRGTSPKPPVVQTASFVQASVVQTSGLALQGRSTATPFSTTGSVGQTGIAAQANANGARTPISSLSSALHSTLEGRAGPVFAVIRPRTPIYGEPEARVIQICDGLADVDAAARELGRSTIATAQLFVAELERIGERQRQAPAAPPPPAVFEPDDWLAGQRVRPDFDELRAQLRETADVEVAP